MYGGSVIRSDVGPTQADLLNRNTTLDAILSPTHAFMTVVFENDVHFFLDNDIHDTRIYLDDGATSTVYKARLERARSTGEPQVIAIKQKRRRGSWFDDEVSLESWIWTSYLDIRIMSHRGLRYARNVTTLLGYFWEIVQIDGERRLSPCLVMPIASEVTPNLDQLFRQLRQGNMRLDMRLKISIGRDIANGVKELHQCGIVHGDLKCANILIFGDVTNFGISTTVKVADFSHSIIMSDYKESPRLRYTGTRPFTIPEVRRADGAMAGSTNTDPPTFSDPGDLFSCDVFSLGMIITTILSDGYDLPERIKTRARITGYTLDDEALENSLDALFENEQDLFVELEDFLHISDIALTPEISDTLGVCLKPCLQYEPSQRCEAQCVVETLSNWLGDAETDPRSVCF
jgi:serine/threonine protein kinase